MFYTVNQVRDYIINLISNNGGVYSDWYVGVAENPRERLFEGHGVNEASDLWAFSTCSTSDEARSVESYFVNTLNTQGDTGGGSNSTNAVYAYKITSHTRE
jgi:hypothetical protein